MSHTVKYLKWDSMEKAKKYCDMIKGNTLYSETYVSGPFWCDEDIDGNPLVEPYAYARIETFSG